MTAKEKRNVICKKHEKQEVYLHRRHTQRSVGEGDDNSFRIPTSREILQKDHRRGHRAYRLKCLSKVADCSRFQIAIPAGSRYNVLASKSGLYQNLVQTKNPIKQAERSCEYARSKTHIPAYKTNDAKDTGSRILPRIHQLRRSAEFLRQTDSGIYQPHTKKAQLGDGRDFCG